MLSWNACSSASGSRKPSSFMILFSLHFLFRLFATLSPWSSSATYLMISESDLLIFSSFSTSTSSSSPLSSEPFSESSFFDFLDFLDYAFDLIEIDELNSSSGVLISTFFSDTFFFGSFPSFWSSTSNIRSIISSNYEFGVNPDMTGSNKRTVNFIKSSFVWRLYFKRLHIFKNYS